MKQDGYIFPMVSNLENANLEGPLGRDAQRGLLKFMTCGGLNDGKSTLLGRLLHGTEELFSDELATLRSDSERHDCLGRYYCVTRGFCPGDWNTTMTIAQSGLASQYRRNSHALDKAV